MVGRSVVDVDLEVVLRAARDDPVEGEDVVVR